MAKSFPEKTNRPVVALAPLLHPEMASLQRRVLELYEKQRAYLAVKPTDYLEELQHRSEDLIASREFTVRTAAEINRAACVMILEDRKGAKR